jgi:hypothetical protein
MASKLSVLSSSKKMKMDERTSANAPNWLEGLDFYPTVTTHGVQCNTEYGGILLLNWHKHKNLLNCQFKSQSRQQHKNRVNSLKHRFKILLGVLHMSWLHHRWCIKGLWSILKLETWMELSCWEGDSIQICSPFNSMNRMIAIIISVPEIRQPITCMMIILNKKVSGLLLLSHGWKWYNVQVGTNSNWWL